MVLHMNQLLYMSECTLMEEELSFIYEKSSTSYIPHDLLFKKLLKHHFKLFIKAYEPKLFAVLDFSTFEFLSEEIILNAFDYEKRILDLVAKVKLKSTGEPIIIHVEPQSYVQKDFSERMFFYASALYHQLNLPIISIALFSFDELWTKDQYKMEVFDYKTFEFNYQLLHLASLHWRDFLHQENPVSATLMCLKEHDFSERVAMKVEFYRILERSNVNKQQGKFLLRFFDTYLPFSKEEEDEVMERLKQDEETFDINSLPIGIEERAREVGKINEKENIAKNMLKEGFSLEKIVKITELDADRVKELKKQV